MFRQGSHDNPYRAAALDAVVHSSSQCEQEPKRQDGRQLQESSGIGGTQQTDFSVVNRLLPPVGYRSETTSNTIGSEKDTTATEQQAHYYPFMPSQGWPSQGWDCSPYYQHSNYTAFWQHQQPYASVFNSSQTFPDPTVPKQHEVGTAAPPPAPPPPPPPPPYHYHIEPYFNNPATFNNHATFNSHASSYPTTPVDTTSPVSSQQHLSPVYVRQQEATSSREDSEQLSQALDQSCCLPLPNEDNTSPGEEEQVKPESSRKPKRSRTAFTESQLDELELEFYKHKYPDVYTRESIARRLNIKADRVQVWFQNKRSRVKKEVTTGSVSFRSKYRQMRLQKRLQKEEKKPFRYFYNSM